jgi:uncharacterized protein YjbI with pentapeptide repeats
MALNVSRAIKAMRPRRARFPLRFRRRIPTMGAQVSAVGEPAKANASEPAKANEGVAELIKSVNDDLRDSQVELTFFLGVALFVIVTTLGVSDRDILLGMRVKLPILGLEIDLLSFLLGAPLLLVTLHLALLLKFVRLRRKTIEVRQRIDAVADSAEAERLENEVASNFVTQSKFGARRRASAKGAIGVDAWLNRVVFSICLTVLPLFALLATLVRGLAVHNSRLTYVHDVFLAIDVALVAYAWSRTKSRAWSIATAALATVLYWLVVLTATVPNSALDAVGASLGPLSREVPGFGGTTSHRAFVLTALLLESDLDMTTRRPAFFGLSRNIVVVDDRTLLSAEDRSRFRDGEPSPPPGSAARSFRGRDLRYARLDRDDLRGVDFTAATIAGANLEGADLRWVQFGCVTRPNSFLATSRDGSGSTRILFNAVLSFLWPNVRYNKESADDCGNARGTNFDKTDLRHILFRSSETSTFQAETSTSQEMSFSESTFIESKLDSDDCTHLNFSLSDFTRASLVETSFDFSNVSGATFFAADLTDSSFVATEAVLTDFNEARLIFVSFADASLVASRFSGASIIGCLFDRADLKAAIMAPLASRDASINRVAPTSDATTTVATTLWWVTAPLPEELSWADLTGLKVAPPALDMVNSIRATLQERNGSSSEDKRINDISAPDEQTRDKVLRNAQGWKTYAAMLSRNANDENFRNGVKSIYEKEVCDDLEFLRVFLALERRRVPGLYDTSTPIYVKDARSYVSDPVVSNLETIEEVDNLTNDLGYVDLGAEFDEAVIPEWIDVLSTLKHARESIVECVSDGRIK